MTNRNIIVVFTVNYSICNNYMNLALTAYYHGLNEVNSLQRAKKVLHFWVLCENDCVPIDCC